MNFIVYDKLNNCYSGFRETLKNFLVTIEKGSLYSNSWAEIKW